MCDDNILIELQEWYYKHCNGYWEHKYGIEIISLDNPGWMIKIDLKETEFENKDFIPYKKGEFQDNVSPKIWIDCYIKDNIFYGAGDSKKLKKIIKVFLDWCNFAKSSIPN